MSTSRNADRAAYVMGGSAVAATLSAVAHAPLPFTVTAYAVAVAAAAVALASFVVEVRRADRDELP